VRSSAEIHVVVSAPAGKYKAEGGASRASISGGQLVTGDAGTPASPTASDASTAHTAIVYSNVSPEGMAFAQGPFSPSPRPTPDTANGVHASPHAGTAASEGSTLQGRAVAGASRPPDQGPPQHYPAPSGTPQYPGGSVQGWDEEGEEVDSKLGTIRTSRGDRRAPEIVPTTQAGTSTAGRPGPGAQLGRVMVSLGAQPAAKGGSAASGRAPPPLLMIDTGAQGLSVIPEAPNTGNSASATNQFRISQVLSPVVRRLDPELAARPRADKDEAGTGHLAHVRQCACVLTGGAHVQGIRRLVHVGC
jgi:hypothetical protein